ncbi:MAG: hypothetical protein RL595_1710 [Planctomycetota bacterium]|jgi:serine/threonine protein kinase
MKQRFNCPEEAMLKAVVIGDVHEPLLDYYLEHIQQCEHCTEIIGKSSWAQLEFQALVARSKVNLADLKPDNCSVDMAWLESVMKNYPAADFNPAGNPDNAFGLPEVIGNFRLTSLLGDGSTSIVCQAVDMNLHRQVALKIIHPGFEGNTELQESILSEARAIASLSHENIVPIYQVEKFGNSPILVFPLLPGSTLQKALQEKQFSLKESLQIIRDLAQALDFIHSRGVLHRDIKPSNIWLGQREDGRPCAKLFDFGFVGLQQNRSGTSGYMAPEQISHLPNSPATDMFALGTLLFQLTRGKSPSEKIRRLVEQLLANNPSQRPDARQVLTVIEQQLRGRRKLLLAGAGLVVAMVGVLVGAKLWSAGPKQGPVATKPEVVSTKPVVNNLVKPLLALESQPRFSSSLSANAKWFVRQISQHELELVDAKTQAPSGRMTVEDDVNGLELNGSGNLLAISGKQKSLHIVTLPDLKIVFKSEVSHSINKMHWAGKKSDILVFQQGGDLFSLLADSKSGKFAENPIEIPLFPNKVKNPALVQDFTCDANADHLLAFTNNQGLVVWSFEKSSVVQLSSQVDKSKESHLGWRDKDTYCVYQGRNVIETSILPENTQRSLFPRSIDQWQLPSAAEDVIWLDEKSLVYLADIGGAIPRIHQLKRGGRNSLAEFDSSGQIVYKLQSLGSSGQFAAHCKSGKVLIFQAAIQ